jgi:hypothetical protein
VVLGDRTLIEEGRTLGKQYDAGVIYWKPTTLRSQRLQITEGRTFDGYNGLSAVCAFVPRAEALARPFRTEVFSAEDQEWAGWYLRAKAGRALQIEHPGLEYLNPKKSIQKSINENKAVPKIYCHSANPVGSENIINYINSYFKNIGSKEVCELVKIDHTYRELSTEEKLRRIAITQYF